MLTLPATSTAQQPQFGMEYTIANRLLDDQEYEQAYRRFLKLYRENPRTYLLLDRLTECLINLQRYEEALDLTREYIENDYNNMQGTVRLGEIHYIRGDSARADSTWDRIASNPSAGLQQLLTLARTMRDRRAFGRAVATYREAERRFEQSSLVASELANTYLMSGDYNEAMQVYLDLIAEQPDRIDELQSTLYRYSDDVLYDTAILELEETMPELSTGHPAYQRLHQLHVWLLMERELYERALATSIEFEDRVSQVTFNLYVTGRRLASERQYALAVEAYRYYIDRDVASVLQRSMQELADVYIAWADYLDDYNLAYASRRDSLYRRAYGLLDDLRTGEPRYGSLGEVLVTQSELALSRLHRPDEARRYLQTLESLGDSSLASQAAYLRGRILLYEENYAQARVELTRSNRREGSGALAEKARYYLAMSDFFSGDYEFAKIQLNALERQNTSYFANDAVRLRVWIQDGLQADSTGGYLDRFSGAMRLTETGRTGEALQRLHAFVDSSAGSLRDDAWLQLASLASPQNLTELYPQLDRYLENAGGGSPLEERLLWERARMADQWLNGAGDTPPLSARSGGEASGTSTSALPADNEALVELYERLLLRFPSSFYASFARDRIQELQSPNET
ncbi:MAG: tetratricopeptide repeat protein [Balneolaceae bacterium]|nr:tetratricopeptide repeat protein [Balneolaceae bacterium]